MIRIISKKIWGEGKKNFLSKDRSYEAEREERNKEKIIKETDKKEKKRKNRME